ncbi:MAG: thermonuclease family protein [Bacteroidota bacterium]|nr:thermonuclease family protein [Bacteroidota bacterium]
MYEYKAILKRVVDGDTMDVIIDIGFKLTTEQRIRLKGVNTPETWRQKKDSEEYKKGMQATNFVVERFEKNNNEFIIKTSKAGVYGRYIAEIFFKDSEISLNEELLKKGFANKY